MKLSAALIFSPSARIHHSWHKRTKGGLYRWRVLVCWGGWCVRCMEQGVTVELPHSLVSRARQKGLMTG